MHWAEPQIRLFTGDAFEIENLLLDAEAMAACDANSSEKDAATLETELNALAQPLAWWMSCRKTIVHFRQTASSDFISHPKRGQMTSKPPALSAIVDSSWWTTVLPALGRTVTVAEATAGSMTIMHNTRRISRTGRGERPFPAKKILGDIRSRLWTRNQQSGPLGKLRLVKSIAEAQRTLNRLPDEVQELRTVLRTRVGSRPDRRDRTGPRCTAMDRP